MNDPHSLDTIEPRTPRTNSTVIILLGALLLLLVIVVFASRGNSDQDKLTNSAVVTAGRAAPNQDKLCASSATYDLIKRELFRRAAQLRGSNQAAFDQLSNVAVIRMENPVVEAEDSSTGAVNCSGSVGIDLPPGIEVAGGRHTLTSDVDYTVTKAADGSGPVILLKNADAIVTPLSTLARVNQPAAQPAQQPAQTNDLATQERTAPASPASPAMPSPRPVPGVLPRPGGAEPSFDCSAARTRGEMAICGDAGLAALDRQMAAQYSRAFDIGSPVQREILRDTAHRFYGFRDHCATNACIGDAYTGRMREIRDIMEGRWQPSQ